MAVSERERRVLRVFAAAVLGRWELLAALRRAAPAGEPDLLWREALLQLHVFAGFPRQVEAYAVLQEAGGLGVPGPDEVRGEPDLPERGGELFERIYGAQAGRIRALLEEGHPDFARWILGHAYGRILTRPGMGADRRELLALAALAALGQERQLASHARGALRCGASRAELEETLQAVDDLVAPERLERARRVLAKLI